MQQEVYRVIDALAGEYLGVHEGVVPVHANCGSTDQKVCHLDYTLPEVIRVRYAACRVHRQAEQVAHADSHLRSPFVRRAQAAQLPAKAVA